jgi:K+-transporting ATPase KdpF subunit
MNNGFRMADGRRRFFRWLRSGDPVARKPSIGGLAVDWTLFAASGMATALAAYLVVALFKPEWFS